MSSPSRSTTFFEEKKRKTSKKPLTLNVDYSKIEREFGLGESTFDKKKQPSSTESSSTSRVSFTDKKKTKHIVMNSSMSGQPLGETTTLWCHWCKHPFTTRPLGCPIKHHINDADESVYETINLFCNIFCMNAHVQECKRYNIDPHLYRETETLMLQLYLELYGEYPPHYIIPVAPNWKLLKPFGGTLEVEELRKVGECCSILPTHMRTRAPPKMISSSEIFESINTAF